MAKSSKIQGTQGCHRTKGMAPFLLCCAKDGGVRWMLLTFLFSEGTEYFLTFLKSEVRKSEKGVVRSE
jgi:hypothetical protein